MFSTMSIHRNGYNVLVDIDDYIKLNLSKYKITIHKPRDRNKTAYAGFRNGKHMHRTILNCPENLQVDHINHNGLDNRKENLRIVTASQNMQNQPARAKFGKGVQKRTYTKKEVYRARIRINKKLIIIGEYETAREAQIAYNKKAIELYGPNCYQNPID